MSIQENIKLVRRLFDFYNLNDPKQLNVCDEILALNLQWHDPAGKSGKSGLQCLKDNEVNYIKAFPHKKATIDNIFAADDQVCVRWTCTAVQEGAYEGHAPTNRRIKVTGITTCRIANGKICEIWQVWDHYGLCEQLGVVTSAAAHAHAHH